MAYTWTNGELITAAKLNQTGGGGVSGLVTDTSDTLDKTWNDINAIVSSGVLPFLVKQTYVYRLDWIDDSDGYVVGFSYTDDTNVVHQRIYYSDTANGTLVLD